MKKSIAILLAVLMCLSLMLTACAPQEPEPAASQEPAESASAQPSESAEAAASEEAEGTRTITDHAGHEVVLPEKVERVAIGGLTPLTSVYCMFMGSSDGLVGIHPDSKNAAVNSILGEAYPGLKDLPDGWASGDDINMEELIKLDPDVVFYNADVTANYDALEAAGIPAVGFSTTLFDDYNTIDTFNAWIELMKEVMGPSDRADGIIAYGEEVQKTVADKLAEIPENSERAVFISAKYKSGIEQLLEAVEHALKPKTVELLFSLGYDEGAELAKIQKHAVKIDISYENTHMDIKAELPENVAKMILGRQPDQIDRHSVM